MHALRISARVVLAMALVGLGLSGRIAMAQNYVFTSFDYEDNTDTEIWGINNLGVATGVTYDSNGTAHGIVVKNGVITTVDAPGAGPLGTDFFQINALGQTAGGYYDANGIAHAFLYNVATKKFTALPDLSGYPFNFAGGVNLSGEVAGNVSTDAGGNDLLIAYLYKAENYHLFVDPLSDQALFGTVTYSLNDAGLLVGFYVDPNSVSHGFVTPGSTGPFTQIDVPGADNTAAYGINNASTIVGRSETAGVRSGFVMKDGKFKSVSYPGAAQTWITSINDFGTLGGFYEDADGNYHAFLARRK